MEQLAAVLGVAASYGLPVEDPVLHDGASVVVHLTVWYALYAGRGGEHAARAADLLATRR